MKVVKYLLLLCMSLFLLNCSKATIAVNLSTVIAAVPFGAGVARWLLKSDYTFESTSGSGILVSFAMTRSGVEDGIAVYYGSFGMDLEKMWTKPMNEMFDSEDGMIDSSDITIDFSKLRIRSSSSNYFVSEDMDKEAIVTVYTNWLGDSTTRYGNFPQHEYCEYNTVKPQELEDGWCANTSHNTNCVSRIEEGVGHGFRDMCLLLKYETTEALTNPPQSFIIDVEIPLILEVVLTGKELVSK